MNKTQTAVIDWLAQEPHAAPCCRAMAFFLAFGIAARACERSHPRGAGDFDECLQLLQTAPGLRKELPKMAALSPEWMRIVAGWGQLEETYRQENNLALPVRPAKGETHALILNVLRGKRLSTRRR
jgi:hypothetical protein